MKPVVPRNFSCTGGFLPIVFFSLFLLVPSGCSPEAAGDAEPVYVFRNITVIDAAAGERSGRSVVTRGNRIVEAGPAGEVRTPAGAVIVEGEGKYLIPGLWDAHVHLSNTSEMRPAMFRLFIANGITYVRDTAATFDSILPIREEAVEAASANGMAPDVYITGPHIDGERLSWASSVSAVTAEQAVQRIDELEAAGVDEMKVYELLSPEIFHEVLQEARDRGYNVTSHVPLTLDVVEAAGSGLTAMEHMQNLELACSSRWEALLEERRRIIEEAGDMHGNDLRRHLHQVQRARALQTQDEERCGEVIRALADNGTWQVPTLVITTPDDHRLFASDSWRETFDYLPEPVRSEWRERAVRMTEEPPSGDGVAYARWTRRILPELAGAGIGIMAGTDMPLALLTPGFSLHQELILMERAGLTPMQVLEAATLAPAIYYGLENRQGSVAAGMAADLVVLTANPLDDISNTQQIDAVLRNGHFHSREDLDEILERLKR